MSLNYRQNFIFLQPLRPQFTVKNGELWSASVSVSEGALRAGLWVSGGVVNSQLDIKARAAPLSIPI